MQELVGQPGLADPRRREHDHASRVARLQAVQEREASIQSTLLFFELEWNELADERVEDVLDAAELALGHRLQADPFAPAASLDDRQLRRLLDEALDAEVSPKKVPRPAA
jgi:transcriptional regulator GlxA family with amidase domain